MDRAAPADPAMESGVQPIQSCVEHFTVAFSPLPFADFMPFYFVILAFCAQYRSAQTETNCDKCVLFQHCRNPEFQGIYLVDDTGLESVTSRAPTPGGKRASPTGEALSVANGSPDLSAQCVLLPQMCGLFEISAPYHPFPHCTSGFSRLAAVFPEKHPLAFMVRRAFQGQEEPVQRCSSGREAVAMLLCSRDAYRVNKVPSSGCFVRTPQRRRAAHSVA